MWRRENKLLKSEVHSVKESMDVLSKQKVLVQSFYGFTQIDLENVKKEKNVC